MLSRIHTPKSFRIQYTSDLHLERYKQLPSFSSLLKPVAPYLALAGDIGHPVQLKTLFEWAAPQWKRIFYITGNHEFYGGYYEDRMLEIAEIITAFKNVKFLHVACPSFFCEEENVAIVGCTLWSSVSRAGGSWKSISDYKQIRFRDSRGTFECLNVLHEREKTVLDAEIAKWTDRGAAVCVLTHHLPSFRLIHPRYALSDVNDCFASNCDNLMRPAVRLWIYGHTHSCSHQSIRDVLCVCNALGYQEEHVPGWRSDVWMGFGCLDPQEAEAAAKRDQTPLKTKEEEEIEFM